MELNIALKRPIKSFGSFVSNRKNLKLVRKKTRLHLGKEALDNDDGDLTINTGIHGQ